MELKESSLRRFKKGVIKKVRSNTIEIIIMGDLVTFAGICILLKDLIIKSNPGGALITIVIGAGIMIEAIEIGESNE